MEFTYTNNEVTLVSNLLQAHMKKNNITSMTADQCASLLAVGGILANTKGPKPGFNFREMLRQCRDGVIKSKLVGVYQKKPGSRWKISYVNEYYEEKKKKDKAQSMLDLTKVVIELAEEMKISDDRE